MAAVRRGTAVSGPADVRFGLPCFDGGGELGAGRGEPCRASHLQVPCWLRENSLLRTLHRQAESEGRERGVRMGIVRVPGLTRPGCDGELSGFCALKAPLDDLWFK